MSGAFELINPRAVADLIIIADHAGNAVPAELGDLGLSPADLARHIAWDIGAGGVARRLAKRLNAPAVLARISRLVIDPNRPLGDIESIPTVSDGSPIPGNRNLNASARDARAGLSFYPYHRQVEHEIARLRQAGRTPAVLSIHSFTPELMTTRSPRPWHVGVMSSYDRKLASYLLDAFSTREGLVVGDNQPYSGFMHGYAMKRHALAQFLAHAQLEIRQDLIGDEAGQERWANLIADLMADWTKRDMGKVANG